MTENKDDEYPKNFAELADMVSGDGQDYRSYAERIYNEGKKQAWPREIIECLVGIAIHAEQLQLVNDDNFADENDLKHIEQKLNKHKHLPDGQAVEPL
jgi:hypothetical protein